MARKKPTRIYFRPRGYKRGHKLTELSHDASYTDCFRWIRENMTFRYGEDTLFRSWCMDGQTIIDYGSYSNYIVINKEVRPE